MVSSLTTTSKSSSNVVGGGHHHHHHHDSLPSTSSSSSSISHKRTWRTIGISLAIGFLIGQTVTNLFHSAGSVVVPMAVDHLKDDLPTILDAPNEERESIRTMTTIATTISTISTISTSTMTPPPVLESLSTLPTQHNYSTTATATTVVVTPEITNNSNNSSTNNNNNNSIVEFERQDRVVIVTKLHSRVHFSLLEQSLCLLHYAYNIRVNYDIVVFYTEDLPYEYVERIKAIVAPAKVHVVMDNKGLHEEVNDLNPERKATLLQRCNVTTVEEMNWFLYCQEDRAGGPQRLAYTWQAEFRALHIWHHPALQDYKTMMWLDTDGFCTRVWPRDPIAYFLQQDLVILFDHFPMGASRGAEFQERFLAAFDNTTLCGVHMTKRGQLRADTGRPCPTPRIPQIHGFFHITNLDFYRSEPVMKWNRILIGKEKFSRRFDDQIAVTVPAAILAPNQSQEMERAGLKLDVFHNFKLDGKYQVGGFKQYWRLYGQSNFSEAHGNCQVNNAGRRRR